MAIVNSNHALFRLPALREVGLPSGRQASSLSRMNTYRLFKDCSSQRRNQQLSYCKSSQDNWKSKVILS